MKRTEFIARRALLVAYYAIDLLALLMIFLVVIDRPIIPYPTLLGYSMKGMIMAPTLLGFLTIIVFGYILMPTFLIEKTVPALLRFFLDKLIAFALVVAVHWNALEALTPYACSELAAVTAAFGVFIILQVKTLHLGSWSLKLTLTCLFGIIPLLWAAILAGYSLFVFQATSESHWFFLNLALWLGSQVFLFRNRLVALLTFAKKHPMGFQNE